MKNTWSFGPSAAERRKQERTRRSLERERKRKLAADIKRSKRETMRQRKLQKRLEAKRKKDEQSQLRENERKLRAERKRWAKPPRQRRRGDDLQAAYRLFDLFGSVLNRVDKNKQAELIAYADEHMAEIYDQFTPEQAETVAQKETGPSFGGALRGLRRLLGLD